MAPWTARIAIASLVLGALASCGADPAGGEESTLSAEAVHAAPALPLRAVGRSIVDARGNKVRLAVASWRGAEGRDYVVSGLDHQSLSDKVAEARKSGCNAVRLSWSNELLLLGSLTTVDPARVARNPELKGKTAMEAFDAVVKAVTGAGLMVILDNRSSDADRTNLRWYSADYPEEKWIADWKAMARRYAKNPLVIAAELRSGLDLDERPGAWEAWAAAAQRAGDAVMEASPHLLVVVAGGRPVKLAQPGHFVSELPSPDQ